jgi:MSHA biogenesis protein MshJ
MQSWVKYKANFSTLSTREQVLITLTGIVVIVFLFASLVLTNVFDNLTTVKQQQRQLINENNAIQSVIVELENALRLDPNQQIKAQIKQYQQTLAEVNNSLLELTSQLVDPVQMRLALEQLLQLQKGVRLISFEVSSGEPIVLSKAQSPRDDDRTQQHLASKSEQKNLQISSTIAKQDENLGLYRHTIKLKLTGTYFQLRDYLSQLEQLPWKFFWEKFDYHLTEYPKSELELEIYSLSLKEEFVGV